MKKRVKFLLILLQLLILLYVCVVYYKKDHDFFSGVTPEGYTLTFNGIYFFSVIFSLWLLFEDARPKQVFLVFGVFGSVGILLPTVYCRVLAAVLLGSALMVFLYFVVYKNRGKVFSAGDTT